MKIFLYFVRLAILLALPLTMGCKGNGTETGDPGIIASFSAFETSQASLIDLFLPKAFASTSEIQMCIHQIRFKADNASDNPGENANINIGLVALSPLGTELGPLTISPGDYRRVDIMIKDGCGAGFSLSVTNDSGTFEINKPKILRFEGDMTVVENDGELIFQIPDFIRFFDSVRSHEDLEDGVENVIGGFEFP